MDAGFGTSKEAIFYPLFSMGTTRFFLYFLVLVIFFSSLFFEKWDFIFRCNEFINKYVNSAHYLAIGSDYYQEMVFSYGSSIILSFLFAVFSGFSCIHLNKNDIKINKFFIFLFLVSIVVSPYFLAFDKLGIFSWLLVTIIREYRIFLAVFNVGIFIGMYFSWIYIFSQASEVFKKMVILCK